MRPPWIDAAALLAAHGHHDAALRAAACKSLKWRPVMLADAHFAIIRPTPGQKPLVFEDLDALARWIQRQRGEQALELVETEDLELEGDMGGRLGVHVYTLALDGGRDRNLGTAWLNGRGRETLQAGLRRNRLVILDDHDDATQGRAA